MIWVFFQATFKIHMQKKSQSLHFEISETKHLLFYNLIKLVIFTQIFEFWWLFEKSD